MIKSLYIDGFKSLKNFKISFNNGLNVLVGPNGSGKSNICQSLGLVSALVSDQLIDYIISTTKGARLAFDRSNDNKQSIIKCSCSGIVNSTLENSEGNNIPIMYDYAFALSLDDYLIISEEKITIKVKNPKTSRFCNTLTIIREKKDAPNLLKVVVFTHNKNLVGLRQDFFEETNIDRKKNEFEFRLDKENGMLSTVGLLYYHVWAVYNDLIGAKVYNIDPHIAKIPSELIEQNEMLPNGKNLANAIHNLEKNDSEALKEINSFLKNINPDYCSLKTDTLQNESKRTFHVVDVNGVSFPANALSDGTIKAIAMLVAILSKKRNIAIFEEPENYLHPWASTSFIEYVRDAFNDSILLISTHSETILNSVTPEELIIVVMNDGYTTCKRIGDPKTIGKIIKQTGFGCGYHFISGSLGGVPS